jgi:hypothetical protein
MKCSRGTEIKFNEYPNLNVVLGTMDKNNPKTIYLRISGWGNPIIYTEDNNYKSIIRRINKRVKTLLYNELDVDVFDINKTMVDLNMRDSGILEGKSSFMSCEITLFQYNNYLLNSDIIMSYLNHIILKVLNDVFIVNEYFNFYKKKIDAKNDLKPA